MNWKSQPRRNILALSGGKDSAALAVYLKEVRRIPDLEYVFLDTGHELPETYEFLNLMRAVLGIDITVLKPKRDFDFWLKIYGGCLPSPQNRWCTRQLKIEPFEKFIGNDHVYSYIALRADEDRLGYISNQNNIVPYYPFIEDGLIKKDIVNLLEDAGLGLPGYYSWRSRSGCYFCFFQRRAEWIGLHENHPKYFEAAKKYENHHSDGRNYTWIQGESLDDLIERKKQVLADEENRKKKNSRKLRDQFQGIEFGTNFFGNDEEKDRPCLICTL